MNGWKPCDYANLLYRDESFVKLGVVFAQLGDTTNGLLYRGELQKDKEP